MLCVGMSLHAQSGGKTLTLSGIVLDTSLDDEPMIGVNVYLRDEPGVGTSTDTDGRFNIKAKKGDVIVFKYLGYDNYEHIVMKSGIWS